MATIGTGKDYSSIIAWIDAAPKDLVATGQPWRGELYAQGPLADNVWPGFEIAVGFTTNDTCRFELVAAAGQSFADHPDRPLRYDPANGATITREFGYAPGPVSTHATLYVRGLQLKQLGSETNDMGNRQTGACIGCVDSPIVIEDCFLFQPSSTNAIGSSPYGTPHVTIKNSVVYMTAPDSDLYAVSSSQPVTMLNCTVLALGNTGGFFLRGSYLGNTTTHNSAIFGIHGKNSDNSGRWDARTHDFRKVATDMAFLTEGTEYLRVSAADQFRSIVKGSIDLRVKDGAAIIGAAFSDTKVTKDVYGRTRSATPTIGAEEVAPLQKVVKTIAYNGDYKTFAEAVTAIKAVGDLVTANQQWELRFGESAAGSYYWDIGDWASTAHNMTSVVTDATHYVHMTTAPGASFKDRSDKLTAKLNWDQTRGVTIRAGSDSFVLPAHSVVDGLQFRTAPANFGESSVIRDCIFMSDHTGQGIFDGKSCMLYNCLFIRSHAGKINHGIWANNYYNCTFVGTAAGVELSCADYSAQNFCIVYNCAFIGVKPVPAYATSFNGYSNHNRGTETPTAGGLTNGSYKWDLVLADTVVSPTDDFRPKTGSGLLDAGSNWYPQNEAYKPIDIIGNNRPDDTPTVGAWEPAVTVSGGGTKPDPVTGLTITNITHDAATATWNASADATGYHTEVATENGSWMLPSNVTGTQRTVSGFSPSTTYRIRVSAYNAQGDAAWVESSTFTTAAAPVTTTPPTVTTTTMPDGTTGVVYSKTLTATGDTPITWTQPSGSLPAGLQLSSAGVISGTPTNAGTATFSVRATNSAGSDDQALSMTVTAAAIAPTITTTTLPDGLAGTAYSQQINATGTSPITYSAASGSLPSGMTLSQSGLLSGTPSVAGVSSFTVRATNSVGSDDQGYNLSITAASVKPTITTSTLYKGKVGTAYATALTATGTSPITWTKVSGDIPPGLSLGSDGAISGTPTTDGSFTFVAKASNVAGDAQASFTMTIDAASTGSQPSIDVPYAQRPTTLDGCWSSWSEQQQQNLLRTQMDSGAIKVRRRTTGIARVAQVSVSLEATKYAAFMSWYNVNCQQGVLPTLMCTPQCNEELWRFVEAPQISWVSKEVFTATATIERMPGW